MVSPAFLTIFGNYKHLEVFIEPPVKRPYFHSSNYPVPVNGNAIATEQQLMQNPVSPWGRDLSVRLTEFPAHLRCIDPVLSRILTKKGCLPATFSIL
jgi:hypothetical protein